jgi:quinol-cytochrome oxidoreductase complex cytochrome b subunit
MMMAEAIDDLTAGERRGGGDRREPGGRRAEDRHRVRLYYAWAATWAIIGAIVVLFLLLTVIGAVNPDKAPAASIVVLVLAVAWLAHAWRRLLVPRGHVSRPDRERRGF